MLEYAAMMANQPTSTRSAFRELEVVTLAAARAPPPRDTSLPGLFKLASMPLLTKVKVVPPASSSGARVVREHEHRVVKRRIYAPPAVPGMLRMPRSGTAPA